MANWKETLLIILVFGVFPIPSIPVFIGLVFGVFDG